jgi:hypothetical protein
LKNLETFATKPPEVTGNRRTVDRENLNKTVNSRKSRHHLGRFSATDAGCSLPSVLGAFGWCLIKGLFASVFAIAFAHRLRLAALSNRAC